MNSSVNYDACLEQISEDSVESLIKAFSVIKGAPVFHRYGSKIGMEYNFRIADRCSAIPDKHLGHSYFHEVLDSKLGEVFDITLEVFQKYDKLIYAITTRDNNHSIGLYLHVDITMLRLDAFRRSILERMPLLSKKGIQLFLVVKSPDVAFMFDAREDRILWFELLDSGLKFCAIFDESSEDFRKRLERLRYFIGDIRFSGSWLKSTCFSKSQFFDQERVNFLRDVIHKHSYTVSVGGISESELSTYLRNIPINIYSLLRSDEDVYVL